MPVEKIVASELFLLMAMHPNRTPDPVTASNVSRVSLGLLAVYRCSGLSLAAFCNLGV